MNSNNTEQLKSLCANFYELDKNNREQVLYYVHSLSDLAAEMGKSGCLEQLEAIGKLPSFFYAIAPLINDKFFEALTYYFKINTKIFIDCLHTNSESLLPMYNTFLWDGNNEDSLVLIINTLDDLARTKSSLFPDFWTSSVIFLLHNQDISNNHAFIFRMLSIYLSNQEVVDENCAYRLKPYASQIRELFEIVKVNCASSVRSDLDLSGNAVTVISDIIGPANTEWLAYQALNSQQIWSQNNILQLGLNDQSHNYLCSAIQSNNSSARASSLAIILKEHDSLPSYLIQSCSDADFASEALVALQDTYPSNGKLVRNCQRLIDEIFNYHGESFFENRLESVDKNFYSKNRKLMRNAIDYDLGL